MPCTVRTVGAGDRVASEFSRLARTGGKHVRTSITKGTTEDTTCLARTGGKHVRTSTHFLKDERIYRPARKTNT